MVYRIRWHETIVDPIERKARIKKLYQIFEEKTVTDPRRQAEESVTATHQPATEAAGQPGDSTPQPDQKQIGVVSDEKIA